MKIQYNQEDKVWLLINDNGIATDEYETENEAKEAIIECKRANTFHRDAYGID